MDLSSEKDDVRVTEDNKNSWSPQESNQCSSNNKTQNLVEQEQISTENPKEMIMKSYNQANMLDATDLQVCKLEDSVFPLSPSTAGSRSPPPYPGYQDTFQQEYYDTRYTTTVSSVNIPVGSVYTTTANQIPVSLSNY